MELFWMWKTNSKIVSRTFCPVHSADLTIRKRIFVKWFYSIKHHICEYFSWFLTLSWHNELSLLPRIVLRLQGTQVNFFLWVNEERMQTFKYFKDYTLAYNTLRFYTKQMKWLFCKRSFILIIIKWKTFENIKHWHYKPASHVLNNFNLFNCYIRIHHEI